MSTESGISDNKVRRGGGSRKGVPNKTTATAKENIIAVFTRLGGTAAMADWARENQNEFYKLYGRLIPVEQHVSGADGAPLPVISVVFRDAGS